jgi:membrane fusion protein (multidrug efflux system)
MKHSFAVVLLSAIVLFGCNSPDTEVAPSLPEIQVVEVKAENVQLKKDYVGQVYGKLDIPIRTRVEGFLEGLHFKEGRRVKKGQLLYTVDSQPFDAAVTGAYSQVVEAQVSLVQAENELKRVQPLTEMNALSERDLDAAIADKGAAEAMVDASKANLQIEEINRSYTKISSPIDGIIGKTNAKVGEFVGRDPNPVILNIVSLIDSIRVEFFITELDYMSVMDEIIHMSPDERREQLPIELVFSDGTVFEHTGFVDFVNREIDETTGTMLVQATFPNPDQLIRPGQFARVRVIIDSSEDGLLIPQRCVSEFQGRYNVMLLADSSKVEQREIEIIGPYRDYFLIKKGLSKGDLIVFEGLQKVKEGMRVEPFTIDFESQYVED